MNKQSKLRKEEKQARLKLAKDARGCILRGETVIINAKIIHGAIHASGGMMANTVIEGASGASFVCKEPNKQ